MKEFSSLQFELHELAKSHALDSLDPFVDPLAWEPLQNPDRELLGQLLITKGRKLLDQGDSKAISYFEKAAQVAAHCPKIYYLLGTAYASQDQNLGCLRSALECFDRSISLASGVIDADVWGAYVKLLLHKGELLSEVGYFQAAKEKCSQFHSLAASLPNIRQAEFLWLWGRCYSLAGKIYGETIDYHGALDKYRLAASKGLNEPEFWKDYGDVHFELAGLLDRPDLYGEAAEFYQRSLKLSHDCFESWHCIALCYLNLFENSGSLLDYDFAKSSFENAVKLDDRHFKVWFNWGRLECEYGKQKGDAKSFQDSIVKLEKANVLEPNHAHIYRHWAEALMCLGALVEDVQLLKAAEKQLILSLEMQPDCSETWHTYGFCLNELGRYFTDERYYRHAMEIFQQGLDTSGQFAGLWHGFGLSAYSIGELNGDTQMIEKACTCFSKAIDLEIDKSAQYWNDWGVALMRLADLMNDKSYIESAVEKFQKALGLQDADAPDDIDPEVLYNYGCAMDFLGDHYEDVNYYEKAVEALSRVLYIDPDYIHARYNLALALSHLGELVMDVDCFQRAAEQFQILLNLDGEDEMAWHEFGMALLNLAHLVYDPAIPDKSSVYFEQAEAKLMHAQALGCSQSFYGLACLYSLTDNIGAGIYYLEKAEANNALPPFDEIMQDEWLENLRQTKEFQAFKVGRDRPDE